MKAALKNISRGFIAGCACTVIAGYFYVAPHITWHADLGNQPVEMAQASEQAVQIAQLLPPTTKPARFTPVSLPSRKPAQ